MKYSFVLPAYKATYLRDAIDSILNQSYTDFELIIVNDASPEDLTSIVNGYHDDRIQYYVNEENVGGRDLVAQWNHCITYAAGEYLILASDDDVYHSQYLEKMDALVDRYPMVNVFRPRVQNLNSRNEVVVQDIVLPEYLSLVDFSYLWIQLKLLKGIPFYIFKRQVLVDKGGFINFPTAWFSDDATVLNLGGNGIVVHSEILFSFRNSGLNITSTWNTLGLLQKKLKAAESFYSWFSSTLDTMKTVEKVDDYKLSIVRSLLPKAKLKHMIGLVCTSEKKAVFLCWHILKSIKSLTLLERKVICREVFRRKFLKKMS